VTPEVAAAKQLLGVDLDAAEQAILIDSNAGQNLGCCQPLDSRYLLVPMSRNVMLLC
jgi:hypothetical protein